MAKEQLCHRIKELIEKGYSERQATNIVKSKNGMKIKSKARRQKLNRRGTGYK